MASNMAAGSNAGFASNIRAATAAAWGAAADVPKKLGNESESKPISVPKKVVLVPSTATIWGLKRTSGAAFRLPSLLNRMGVGPAEEKDSSRGGLTSNSGVSP